MSIIFYLIIFFLGLSFGSFLNCLVYRLREKKSLLERSFCPKCKKTIAWYDNIPVISFIFLNGKCRQCHKKISWQYPLVELATGILFVASVCRFNLSAEINEFNYFLVLNILRDWVMIFALLFIFLYDLKFYEIDDRVILPACFLVFILNLFIFSSVASADLLIANANFLNRLLNLFLAGAIGVSFFGLQYLLTKGKGIGLGDLRIGLLIGLGLAFWKSLLIALFISYIIGAIVSLFLVAIKKKSFKSRIPLGPFLTIGTLLAMFFGQYIKF